MKCLIITLFAFIFAFSNGAASDGNQPNQCPPNEHVASCIPCTVSCYEPQDKPCSKVCRINIDKCYCRPGYLRNRVGVCVPKDECWY
ncbi:unnamed protein product [Acanthoscelides obtectus]|uniref:TIL domain-containing protein n=1 Tax=Acanthoscelides obtectus TaxID=200917 RepID=A0A9P0JK42_ACAOB|nr:unnamed protein product [Acanthoscelides obtectus]CAK1678853.1 hypothetical protein AOBTE_LOCUS32043 [Acanthoscelides obtectus]